MRLRELNLKTYRESLDSQSAARRENPAKVIKLTLSGITRRHVLPVGDSDDFDLYDDGTGRIYCVSINRAMDYCGVQAYDAQDQEPSAELSIFHQGQEWYAETLGPRGLDLSDRTIARRLITLLSEVTA